MRVCWDPPAWNCSNFFYHLICARMAVSDFMTPAPCPSFAQAQRGVPDTPCSGMPLFSGQSALGLGSCRSPDCTPTATGCLSSDLLTQPGRCVLHVPRGKVHCRYAAFMGKGTPGAFSALCPALQHHVLCQSPALVLSVYITITPLSRLSAFISSKHFSHFYVSQY